MTPGDAWRRVASAATSVGRRATPRAILIAGYVAFLLYAFPGYLTTESADQLVDSRGHIGDWHSPAMSVVWWLVETVAAGSFGMLVVQSGLVLAGAYHLVHRVLPGRGAALAACAVLLFPPVLAPLAVVWRDAQMAGFLLAGAAAVTSERRPVQLVGLGLLFLGCAMRDTAAFAALPILVFGWSWRGARWWQRGSIAVALWAVVALGALAFNAAVTDFVTQRDDAVARVTGDILGVLRYSGALGDAELNRELAGTPLAVREGIQGRARGPGNRTADAAAGNLVFDPPETGAQREAMLDARARLARAHPWAYFVARWHVFYRIAWARTPGDPVYSGFLERPVERAAVGQLATHAWTQCVLTRAVRRLGGTWLFLPVLYLVLAVTLLPLAIRRRQRDATMLLASGLAHAIAVLFLATAPELRLAHWTILCTSLAAAQLIAGRFARPPARS